MINRLFDLYLRIVTEYPRSVLLCVALLTIGLALGLPRFKLDASSESLTLEHDADLDFYREVSKDYRSGDFLIVTFRPQAELFSDEALALLGDLKGELADIEGVVSINSILDVPLLYSPKQSLKEIVDQPRTLLSPGVDRAQAKEEFLHGPIYKNMILGPDGQTTALQLNLKVDETYIALVQRRDALRLKRDTEGLNADEKTELQRVSAEFLSYRTAAEARSHQRVEAVRAVVANYRDRAQIFVGGITMITADMITFIKHDLVVFGSAVIAFMLAFLAIIFRSWRFVIIPMVCCLTAVVMMLGYVSWLDWRLTVISSNFVALLLIISLAIIIHLVVRYREFAAENPQWSRKQLAEATVRFMARPCLYTALTTIVAFVSFVVSDIRPVIDFGWMMTIGLSVALALAFVIMPATLVLLPREKLPATASPVRAAGEPFTLIFSRAVENYGTWVLVGSLVLAVLSVIGIARLQVENRFIDYFHDSTEIYQGLSVIDSDLGGTTTLDIVIDSDPASAAAAAADGEDDPFDAPADEADDDPFAAGDAVAGAQAAESPSFWLTVSGLQQIQAVHDYLESLPEVGKVQSLATLYQVGRDINGSLNDFELALMTRSLSPQVREVLIAPFVAPDGKQTRISLRVRDGYPDLKRKALVERIRAQLLNDLHFDEKNVRFSGLLVLYNNMLQSLFRSQIVTIGVVFVCIMLMFVVLFRSLIEAVVGIIPNMLAAAFILGAMGLFGLPLDMMTITIAAITVGIGVDNTIHYIYRFKKEILLDGDYRAAMHRSHRSIGRAMYYTSVIIIFGFAIMALSEFVPTIYFGLLTGLAMFAALMGALLLLPKLILLVRPFAVPQPAAAGAR